MRTHSHLVSPKTLLVFDVLQCVFVCLFCARFSDWPLCSSVGCSATPYPSQGQKSGHLMVSSTGLGAQKHSLSEGKLETKSSEESCELSNVDQYGRLKNFVKLITKALKI